MVWTAVDLEQEDLELLEEQGHLELLEEDQDHLVLLKVGHLELLKEAMVRAMQVDAVA